MNQFTVESDYVGERVDVYVYTHITGLVPSIYLPMITRTLVTNHITEFVKINGLDVVKKGYKLREGDLLEVDMDRLVEIVKSSIEIKEEIESIEGSLDIVEESDEWMVIRKPKGLVVHPGEGNWTGTLANIVKGYLESKNSFDNMLDRAGIVHRLDKGVSGLMIIAKTATMQAYLKEQFESHKVVKIYKAKVSMIGGKGALTESNFDANNLIEKLEKNNYIPGHTWYRAEGYIGRDGVNRKKMRFEPFTVNKGTKYALSYIKLLKDGECLIKIETGRMHQIRATLRYLGYCIDGDTLYGSTVTLPNDSIALESIYLGIELPNVGFRVWTI